MKNLGLLRFMNKNLFSFTKDGNLFVHLAEVQYRGLLPVHNVDKCFILSYPVWRLVSSEVREIYQYVCVWRVCVCAFA